MTWQLCDTDWNHWPDNWSDKDCFENALEQNLSGIELGVYSVREQLSADRLASLREVSRSTGVRVSGLLLSLPTERWANGALVGASAQVAVEVSELAAIAASFGIGVIGVWPGADAPGATPESLASGIEAVADAASRHGVRVAFEYKPDTAMPNALATLDAVRYVENAGVLVDTGHAYALGEDPAEVIRQVARARKLWHMHLGDAGSGGADDDLPVGRLNDPSEYLAVMQEVGYTGNAAFDLYGAVEDGLLSSKDAVAESTAAVRAASPCPRAR